jgi:hypothetical protein
MLGRTSDRAADISILKIVTRRILGTAAKAVKKKSVLREGRDELFSLPAIGKSKYKEVLTATNVFGRREGGVEKKATVELPTATIIFTPCWEIFFKIS